MTTILKRPNLALAYYISLLLLVCFMLIAIARHVFPISEPLDLCTIVAVGLAICLLLYGIYAAWNVKNNGR